MPVARSDPCRILSQQIASALDRSMSEAAELQPTQRTSSAADRQDSMWGFDGHFTTDLGPAVPALSKREWLSSLGYLNSLGQGGNRLATLIERWQNTSDIRSRSDVAFLQRSLKPLSNAEQANLIQVVERRTHEVDQYGVYLYKPGERPVAPANARVAEAAQVVKEYLRSRELLAESEGIEGFRGIKDYFPIMHKTDSLRNERFRENATAGLAEKIARRNGRTTPNVGDRAAAQLTWSEYVQPQFAQIAPNLQRHREFDVGADRIVNASEALSLYAQQFWRSVEEKRIFGARDKLTSYPLSIMQLMDVVRSENPSNRAWTVMKAIVDDSFGIKPHDPFLHNAIVQGLGTAQTLKLSMSVLPNLSQSMNTWYRTNVSSLARAVGALVGNSEAHSGIPAREFASMMASVADNALYEATLFQPQGIIGQAGSTLLKYTGFTKVESMNRALAGMSGALYAQQQASKLIKSGSTQAARALAELGIDPQRVAAQNGVLSLEDKLIAGQKLINYTQFRSRQTDLPFFTSYAPDWGRTLLQFRTFSFNQARFVMDEVSRNPARLALFGVALMPAVGAGINFSKDLITTEILGAPLPRYRMNQDATSEYLEAATGGGSFGLFSDLLYTTWMAGGNNTFRNFLVPPIISSLDDYIAIAGNTARGNTRGAAYAVGRQFGGLGSAFVRGIYPSENQ